GRTSTLSRRSSQACSRQCSGRCSWSASTCTFTSRSAPPARPLSDLVSGEVGRGRADPLQLFLQFLRALEVGACQLPAQLALAQAQEELLRRLVVDTALGRARIQLGEQRHERLVRIARLEQVGPRAPVQLGVEMLRAEP